MERAVVNADGSRTIQTYIGPSTTYAEPGWDAPQHWRDGFTLQPGEILSDWVHTQGADINALAHPESDGIVIDIGGVRHGLSLDAAQQLIDTLTKTHGIATQQAQDRAVARKEAEAAELAAQADRAAVAAQEAATDGADAS